METNEKPAMPLILIVDDTPRNIQVLGTVLHGQDYQIAVSSNGTDAIERAKKIIPDLILLDIMMPGMDGFEVCLKLKQVPETKDIPVIFLTAKRETEDVVKGFECGAVDYITKPFNPVELFARVKNHINLKKSEEIIARQSLERQELLHVLCHDLINPLGAVAGLLEFCNDLDSFNEIKPLIGNSIDNSLEVIDLVRKMLAINEGKMQLELEQLNLSQAIAKAAAIIAPRLEKKKILVENNIHEDIVVIAEQTSFINSVLNNLLNNAVKFSYPGSKIIADAVRNGEKTELTIRDYGIGIPENLRQEIFNINKPTSRKGTEGETGTGFGMPLVKRFIEEYGGTIDIDSNEESDENNDHGTTIKITLQSA